MTLRITLIIVLSATAVSVAMSTLVGLGITRDWHRQHIIEINTLNNDYQTKISKLKEELSKVTTINNSCQIFLADTKRELSEFSNWRPESNKPIMFNKNICVLGSMGPYCVVKLRGKYKGKR